MEKSNTKPIILGILSLIIVVSVFVLDIVRAYTDSELLENAEYGILFGLFYIGTGLAIGSIIKETNKKIYIVLPILSLLISALLIFIQINS